MNIHCIIFKLNIIFKKSKRRYHNHLKPHLYSSSFQNPTPDGYFDTKQSIMQSAANNCVEPKMEKANYVFPPIKSHSESRGKQSRFVCIGMEYSYIESSNLCQLRQFSYQVRGFCNSKPHEYRLGQLSRPTFLVHLTTTFASHFNSIRGNRQP